MAVVDDKTEPIGIITASDVLRGKSDAAPVSQVMTRKVFTVPKYADPSLAARIMRNHRIHHVLVTHEKKLGPENARTEKRENFTETEEERRKRSDIFLRELAGKFAGVEASTGRREEIVDAAG